MPGAGIPRARLVDLKGRDVDVGVPSAFELLGGADLVGAYRGVLIDGAAGAVKVTDGDGNDIVFNNIPVGQPFGGVFTRIWVAGTTATDVYGLL